MSSKPTGKENGRPNIPIDWTKVDGFLEDGWLGTEIAAYFSMHPDTFYTRVMNEKSVGFTEYRQQKLSKGDGSLRSAQMKKALKGDNSMLIWLGKNRLGQKDSPSEIELPVEITGPFEALMKQLQARQKDPSTTVEPRTLVVKDPDDTPLA